MTDERADDVARLLNLGGTHHITVTPENGRLRIVARHADGGQTVAWADDVSVENGVFRWTFASRGVPPLGMEPTRGARASSECPDPTGQPGTTEPTQVSRERMSRAPGGPPSASIGPDTSV